jgi:hypothetical protein
MITSTVDEDKPKRKPGAQPGNTNALKHGLHANQPLPSKIVPAEVDPASGLHEEIAMLRVFMRRVMLESDRPMDHRELLDTMRALSLASLSIARLLKVQHLVYGESNELEAIISQAITNVSQEMNLHL